MFAIFRRQVFRDMLKWPFLFLVYVHVQVSVFTNVFCSSRKIFLVCGFCLERTRLDVIFLCFFKVRDECMVLFQKLTFQAGSRLINWLLFTA
jgi:hypothetical protein